MQRGFSLVELSIVLVILGLLTGGILAGQSLIRASELRAATMEFQRYRSSIMSFRDKYMALPGDMTNATSFWGAAHATPATCYTTSTGDARTCNGNGDGRIVENVAGTGNESFRAWQQLANAGLVEGSYTGISATGGSMLTSPGVNIPRSRMTNSGWHLAYYSTAASGDTYFFEGFGGNHMLLGAQTTWGGPEAPAMKPEEAWGIDSKLDDGLPGRGSVQTFRASWKSNCADGNTTSAQYAFTYSSNSCPILFIYMQ